MNPPAWITYASLIIAALAFVNTYLTNRRSGPLVAAHLSVLHDGQSISDLKLKLELNNKGLSGVEIKGATLAIAYAGGLIQESRKVTPK